MSEGGDRSYEKLSKGLGNFGVRSYLDGANKARGCAVGAQEEGILAVGFEEVRGAGHVNPSRKSSGTTEGRGKAL